MNTEIIPHQGLNGLPFGIRPDEAISLLGTPNLVENETEEESGFHLSVQVYDNHGLSLFYNSGENVLLRAIETVNKKMILWGETIFDFNEAELIDLLKKNGEKSIEKEREAWGELRISSPSNGIDFYFENGRMNAIYWEQG
jgi:hypothetical protein